MKAPGYSLSKKKTALMPRSTARPSFSLPRLTHLHSFVVTDNYNTIFRYKYLYRSWIVVRRFINLPSIPTVISVPRATLHHQHSPPAWSHRLFWKTLQTRQNERLPFLRTVLYHLYRIPILRSRFCTRTYQQSIRRASIQGMVPAQATSIDSNW